MNVETTFAHRSAADVVAAFLGTTPISARTHLTRGPTVVVEVVVDDELTVFVKAGSNQNVHTEADVIGHARRAGLPAPEVIGIGTDARLPGGRWMITRAATGVNLEHIGFQAPTTIRTLTDIADLYACLHRVTLPGFGRLPTTARAAGSPRGRSGNATTSSMPSSPSNAPAQCRAASPTVFGR